jgi:hypothetical protein
MTFCGFVLTLPWKVSRLSSAIRERVVQELRTEQCDHERLRC